MIAEMDNAFLLNFVFIKSESDFNWGNRGMSPIIMSPIIICKHTDGFFKLDTVFLRITLSLPVAQLKPERAICHATVDKPKSYIS